eukprot:5421414-Ditylum_brightwellii.AAC.1
MNKRHSHNCRNALLYAKKKWPEVIPSTFWPFCYKTVEERYDRLDLNINGMSLHRSPAWSQKGNCSGWLPHLGCPVFVLDSKLQSDQQGIGPP